MDDRALEVARLRGVEEGMKKAAALIEAEWAGLSRFRDFREALDAVAKAALALEKS